MEAAKKNHQNTVSRSKAVKRDFDALEDQVDEVRQNLIRNKEARESLNRSILVLMKADNLVSDFKRIEDKIGSNEIALKMLQTQYDNSTLGAYVQSKMTKLVNSDLFCSAQKTCSEGKKNAITDATMKEQVFKVESAAQGGQPTPAAAAGGTR